jgi:hypothetical protein
MGPSYFPDGKRHILKIKTVRKILRKILSLARDHGGKTLKRIKISLDFLSCHGIIGLFGDLKFPKISRRARTTYE